MENKKRLKIRPILIIAAVILFSLPIYTLLWSQRPQPVAERHAMAASAHPLASKVGLEILKKGGNAIDAAVATAFALGVVEPFASGIGGGGFMLIYMAKNKQVVTIDYREMAPLRATPKMYQTPSGQVLADRMKEGHLAVAIPGTLSGLSLALSKYGTMDLKNVMGPAIELAENGYEVSKLLARMIENNSQKLSKFPASARIYLKDGHPYKSGDRFYSKDLARTYRQIAKEGPQVFYKGAIAEAIEREMKSGKGLITREDLAVYQPVLRSPVKGSYRGYEVFSMGPPSSGGTHVIELLNIFEGYDIPRLGLNTSESIRVMAEAMKRVFSYRERYMGDPDFVKVPLKELLSKEHAEKLRKEMSTGKVIEKRVPSYLLAYASDQTSHISIVDSEGNLVALTQTINSFFGSGVIVPGTGILLNNEMNDFIPKEGSPNSIKPKKRPVSNMSPTLVLKDGKPYMTIGMPGATRIISVLPQILMNMIDHKMTIQKAIDAPRVHCEADKEIFVESRIPKGIQEDLVRQGYHLTVKKDFDLYFGGTQGVMIDPNTGVLRGGADPRREGSVMGYRGAGDVVAGQEAAALTILIVIAVIVIAGIATVAGFLFFRKRRTERLRSHRGGSL